MANKKNQLKVSEKLDGKCRKHFAQEIVHEYKHFLGMGL